MIETKTLLADKKWPSWIKDHGVFKTNKKIDKVFPYIGLPNCEEETAIDNSAEAIAAARNLIIALVAVMTKRQTKLTSFASKKDGVERKSMHAKRKQQYATCQKLIAAVKNVLSSNANTIQNANGKITVNLPCDIINDGNILFKAGEGVFRVYNKLNEMLIAGKFLPMDKVDNIAEFKEFSAKNIPANRLKVVFASDGTDGLWDIATMSMRGIKSCQSWSDGSGNSAKIIGSIVDPFTGIIYLTSGAACGQYGSKMLRRCVVRFVVDRATRKQSIYLEKMYPSLDNGTKNSFVEFIKRKTDGKFNVIYGPDHGGAAIVGNYIPMASIIKNMDTAYHPYRDSAMEYRIDVFDKAGGMKEKTDIVFSRVAAMFGTKVLTTARTIKMATIPEASKAAFRRIRGTGYYDDRSYQVYEDLVSSCKQYCCRETFYKEATPEAAIKAALSSFCDELPTRIAAVVKSACRNHDLGVIDNETVQRLADASCKKIVPLINDEIKKLVIKKPDATPNDVPVYVKLLN